MTVDTATLLQTAAGIASRFEAKGQPITPTDALTRATAGYELLAEFLVLRGADPAALLPGVRQSSDVAA